MKIKKRAATGYYYAYPRGGKPISLKTRNEADAKRTVDELGLRDLERQSRLHGITASAIQLLRSGRKVSVSKAVDAFIESMPLNGYRNSSIYRASASLKQWMAQCKVGDMQVAMIDAKHIDRWVNPPNKPLKQGTRLRNLAIAVSFFRYCTHQGWLIENPAVQVTVRRDLLSQEQLIPKETLPFTDDEVRQIVASLEPGAFWRFATLCAYYTGLRMGDIAKLEWTNIKGDEIVISTGKTGAIVRHPLNPELREELGKIERSKSLPYLFPDAAACILASPSGQATLSHQFKRICLRLGIDKHFHGMRHTFALRKKAQEKQAMLVAMLEELATKNVMQSMGHTTAKATKNYLNHK